MHYLLAAILTLIGSSPIDMSGIWKLPTKNVPAELMIFHPQVSTPHNTMAIMKLNPLCKKPVMLPLYGNISRSGKEIAVVLESKALPLSKQCSFTFTLMAAGKMLKNKFKARGVVVNIVKCEKREPKVQVDVMDGVWLRLKSTKPAKSTPANGIRI